MIIPMRKSLFPVRPIQIPRIKRVVDAKVCFYLDYEEIYTKFRICFFKSISRAFKSLSLQRQVFYSFMA